MERLSDRAIEIINELHTERLDYESEYLPLIDCADKCRAYEDTGLEPEHITAAVTPEATLNLAGQFLEVEPDRLRELAQADKLIGKTVWLTKWFTKNVQIANPPLQRTIRYISVCKNGEILMHLKDGAFPIQLIGDCAFTSQEEAEAALRREQDG